MAFDWRNNLFQGSDRLRGLSGHGGSAVALDESNSFYNFRLRRHYTDAPIAQTPSRIWFTNDDPEARTGLGPHVAEALTEGQRFTDVLVVLSDDDHDVALATDPQFARTLERVIRGAYAELVARSGGRPSSRPLGVWLVRDGAAEIGGTSFGLVEGEFITGIVPNLYRAPGPHSRPILAFHVHVPGAWEGYREVGRLYDDQVLFTFGNHWLDNFSHPSLREAALYRLQRGEDGAFFHVVNPDLQERYQVTSTDQGGTSVITLATRDGIPLAYLVVVVVEADEAEPVPDPGEVDPLGVGRIEEADGPSLGFDDLVPVALDRPEAQLGVERTSARGPGSRTIVPEGHQERIFTLQERGALLQKVHFSGFMLGYDVYVGHRGELGTVVDQPAATFQVRKKTVSLLANADGVRLDGEPVPPGESRLIEGDAVVQVGAQRLEYRELRHVTVEGWPYVGEIRRPASSTYMLWGRTYTIGRSRDCRVVLPDEPRNDNIVWKPKIADGSTIRSKTGEIPKSRFYTDSIMVASEHAAIDLLDDVPHLSCNARHCFTFVRRGGQVLTLWPTESGREPTRMPLEPGDEVLVGNCLFHVGFAPTEDAPVQRTPAPAPAPAVSASSLVDAVSLPVIDLDGPLDPDDEIVVGLPEVDPADAPVPPAVEPAAEAALSAARRNWPDELVDLSDAPLPRIPPAARPPVTRPVFVPDAAARPAASTRPPVEPVLDAPALPADGEVVVVDDKDAQFELGRPARLVLIGWSVNGTVTCGNHGGCQLVVPENRIDPEQRFAPRTYFELRVRGRKGRLSAVDAEEVRIDGAVPQPAYEELGDVTISVLRRDEDGEVDFTVDLRLEEDPQLPDPRARLVRVDTSDPLALALVARGFPVRAPRTLRLGGLVLTGTFDGVRLELTDYLDTYRTADGFRALFVQTGGGRFQTAPEDGRPIVLSPGDRVLVDGAVYQFQLA